MDMEQVAYLIDGKDNVATALTPVVPGPVKVLGAAFQGTLAACTEIPTGHKIALQDIQVGQPIIKYHVVIGEATKDIPKGSWVHLHCMKSLYDERANHLDINTGVPMDMKYE